MLVSLVEDLQDRIEQLLPLVGYIHLWKEDGAICGTSESGHPECQDKTKYPETNGWLSLDENGECCPKCQRSLCPICRVEFNQRLTDKH